MKIFKIIIIFLLFFQTGCGYKIVNNLDNFKFKIIDYKLTGEKKINDLLEKNFRRFEDHDSQPISNFIVHANSSIDKDIYVTVLEGPMKPIAMKHGTKNKNQDIQILQIITEAMITDCQTLQEKKYKYRQKQRKNG